MKKIIAHANDIIGVLDVLPNDFHLLSEKEANYRYQSGNWPFEVYTVNDEIANRVADLASIDPSDTAIFEVLLADRTSVAYTIEDPLEQSEANAALIAAAPELLEACKGALAALSQHKTFPADIDAAKSFLTDAIAKAEYE